MVPVCGGRRGSPVLWDSRFVSKIMALEGDAGARSLIVTHTGNVAFLETSNDAVWQGFDAPSAEWTGAQKQH